MKDLVLKCGAAILLCLAAGGLGALFTDTGSWYQQLNKPDFSPPSWLFAPVWSTLYILMGIAAGLVWHQEESPSKRFALSLFWIQLLLNALWSISFFEAQSPLLGFINMVLLLGALVATLYAFFNIRKLAGWLLVPYLGWVGFATLLNLQLLRLN